MIGLIFSVTKWCPRNWVLIFGHRKLSQKLGSGVLGTVIPQEYSFGTKSHLQRIHLESTEIEFFLESNESDNEKIFRLANVN